MKATIKDLKDLAESSQIPSVAQSIESDSIYLIDTTDVDKGFIPLRCIDTKDLIKREEVLDYKGNPIIRLTELGLSILDGIINQYLAARRQGLNIISGNIYVNKETSSVKVNNSYLGVGNRETEFSFLKNSIEFFKKDGQIPLGLDHYQLLNDAPNVHSSQYAQTIFNHGSMLSMAQFCMIISSVTAQLMSLCARKDPMGVTIKQQLTRAAEKGLGDATNWKDLIVVDWLREVVERTEREMAFGSNKENMWKSKLGPFLLMRHCLNHSTDFSDQNRALTKDPHQVASLLYSIFGEFICHVLPVLQTTQGLGGGRGGFLHLRW